MKRIITIVFAALSLLAARAQDALVIIAHGSPESSWNEPVLNLEKEVKDAIEARGLAGRFDCIRVALMEFSTPTIADVVRDCGLQGIRRIFAIPLFIAPSSHSEQDVPNILGIKYNPEVIEDLLEEGAELVDTDIKITLGPTLDFGDAVPEIISDRIRHLATGRSGCSFVLLAHGDPVYYPFYDKLMRKCGELASQKNGILFGASAKVGMGQSFFKDLLPAVNKAAESGCKTILVQGVYLSSKVADLVQMGEAMGGAAYEAQFPEGVEIVYGEQALLPDPRISGWIADRAAEWLDTISK